LDEAAFFSQPKTQVNERTPRVGRRPERTMM
jgi:hypothetical protein